jgi:hypothetical protein
LVQDSQPGISCWLAEASLKRGTDEIWWQKTTEVVLVARSFARALMSTQRLPGTDSRWFRVLAAFRRADIPANPMNSSENNPTGLALPPPP